MHDTSSYAQKLERMAARTLLPELHPKTRDFVRQTASRFRFTYQELREASQAARDLEMWRESPLEVWWSETEPRIKGDTRSSKRQLFQLLRERQAWLAEQEKIYPDRPLSGPSRRRVQLVTGEQDRTIFGRCGVSAETFGEWWHKLVAKSSRRGEAVLIFQRPDGQILLHTKQFYPEGIFRLPSGGIHPDEPVLEGMLREAKEETGLDVILDRFLGTIEYEFRHEQQQLPFVSYVFALQVDDSLPVAQDEGEQISDFRYVSPASLRQVAAQLRTLPDRWGDWGQFRAPPHDLAADALLA